ncbi:peptidylprolyl isomerase [Adhaeribacter radiodurans]|uniref:Periplasmic chaperone PpiD n=1 Tax=Adhaeribacter radiodurans TaxID=2745197 RepID=A0A7L7LEQ8_9BACT|nr:peptidylprolyl isomerase [Adhaeribacter radiodurans]QMU31164.1 SurA N-terminal domain-containing protein [Adhaeribacter radiodurans]
MSLINKIREKSGVAVGLIALAMVVFMVLGDLLGPQSRLFGSNNVVGEIAGKEITIEEFDQVLEGIKNNYASQTGKQPNENEMTSLREQAWNQLIVKVAYQKELDRLGISVSDDELIDMVQGNNIHPAIKQAFTNPQTQQFDRSLVKNYLRDQLPKAAPEQRAAWDNFESNLGPERSLTKYNNLIRLSNYVTTVEAKRALDEQNTKVNIKYLLVPFSSINDSSIKVTDDQLKAYFEKNKEKYKVEEGRSVEYVTVPVSPSKEDSLATKEEFDQVVKQFATVDNDSLFVSANSDVPFNGQYVNPGSVPEKLKNANLQKGAIFGPYLENGMYTIYKVTDVKDNGPASSRASHILIRWDNETPAAKAAAKKKAQDVLNQIKGGADFAMMARQYGTDGTASVGGDLGYFSAGAMVAPFEKAVFDAKSLGLLPEVVETQFGYHIIKVTAPKTTRSYQIATVQRAVAPSETTRDMAFKKADQLQGESKSAESFRKNIAQDKSLIKTEAKSIKVGDRAVNTLSNARELVRWAFNDKTDVGSVSPVFEIDDQFVVAVLTGKNKKGYAAINDVKEELTAAVRNELKSKQITEKLKGMNGSLEQIAAKYGAGAAVQSANDITFAAGNVDGLGIEPVVVGQAFGLKPGKRSAPIEGQSGVVVVEVTSMNKTPGTQDLVATRKQLEANRSARIEGGTYQYIREQANIKDERVKFF